MEEDKSGLKLLIAHRHGRPSYARMISWEFSRCKENENEIKCKRKLRKSKRDKKKNSVTDDEMIEKLCLDESDLNLSHDRSNLSNSISEKLTPDCSYSERSKLESNSNESGSESEYFTAEEEDSLSISLSSESDENVDSVFEASFTSSATSDDVNTNKNVLTANLQVFNRKRAPSKKQKRKRKGSMRQYFLEHLPFTNVQFDDEEDECETNVQKIVPSLVDLCIKTIIKKPIKSQATKHPVPHGIKPHFSSSHGKLSLVKCQLSWFYQLLSHFEPKDIFEESYMYSKSTETRTVAVKKVLIPMRNIWNTCHSNHQMQFGPHRYEYDQVYRGHYKSCCLAYTHYIDQSQANLPETPALLVMSVLGSTIDLMLSSTIHLPKKSDRDKMSDDNELMNLMTQEATSRVKEVMSKRYPTITKHLFDRVLPYVFWARGDVSHAVEAFRECIEKQTSVRHKAMYINEIGRMYAMFDEPKQAIHFFVEAADMLFEKNTYQKDEITRELEHQLLLLKASVYDQGVMTSTSAGQSETSWMASLLSTRKPKSFDTLDYLFAMDAFLCFHSGTWKSEKNMWLEKIKEILTRLCNDYPDLFYHLSMVHALEGNARDSHQAYRSFNVRGLQDSPLPGQNVKESCPNSTRPWEELARSVQEHGIPKPLHVLWRRQFALPRYHNECLFSVRQGREQEETDPREADVSSKELNLRMTSDGYITGDMQMLLPPIRGIYLNPYTGAIVFPQIPGDTENWKSLHLVQALYTHRYEHEYNDSTSCIPTMTEIYHDSSGISVQLLTSSLKPISDKPKTPPFAQLMLFGPQGGLRAKVNLVTKLRENVYENVKESILKSNKRQEEKDRMYELLKISWKKEWRMISINVFDDISTHVSKEFSRRRVKQGKGTNVVVKRKYRQFKSQPYNLLFLKKPFVFGKNIFLCLKLDEMEFFVFINCSSKEDFLKPVIKKAKMNIKLPVCSYRSSNWTKAEVLYLTQEQCIHVYDRYGNKFDMIDSSVLHDPGNQKHRPVVIGSTTFAISKDQSLYCTCNTSQRWAEYLGVLDGLGVIGELLVVITVDGYIRFVEATSLLPVGMETEANSSFSLSAEGGDLHFPHKFQYFQVLGEKSFEDSSQGKFLRAAIAVENHLIIVRTNPNIWKSGLMFEEPDVVMVTSCVELSGQAREICFISELVGYFVSVTQHIMTKLNYRENIYHFNHRGRLLSVLPCLGPGPRSFLPLYLSGDQEPHRDDDEEGTVKAGWHIYMRDGHDGIMCVRL